MNRTTVVLGTLLAVIGTLGCDTEARQADAMAEALTRRVKSDLRNLATAQETYFADSLTYAPEIEPLGYLPSQGVTIAIVHAGGDGWAATGKADGTDCAIYYGWSGEEAPADVQTLIAEYGLREGVIECR